MQYIPQLRIGDGPWLTAGPSRKTYAEAKALGVLIAKWWLGVAESDVEGDNLNKRESLRKLVLAKRSRKAVNLNKTEESYVQQAVL